VGEAYIVTRRDGGIMWNKVASDRGQSRATLTDVNCSLQRTDEQRRERCSLDYLRHRCVIAAAG
jgi:hypothetical protein